MKNKRALRSTLIAAGTVMAASLVAAPTMAELNQECLFTGEILQKQADTPFKSDSPALMTAKMHVAVQSVVARDRRCNSKPLTTFRRYPRFRGPVSVSGA